MAKRIRIPRDKAGLPPGTPIFIGEDRKIPCSLSVIDYNQDAIKTTLPETLDDCKVFRGAETISWITSVGLQDAAAIEKLCNIFALHALTTEDILNTTQRPKTEIFSNYTYIVLRMLSLEEGGREIESDQVSLILGENYLLSFQEHKGDAFEGVRKRLFANRGKIRRMGSDYLAYALIDAIVDQYFTVLEEIGEQIEAMEEDLLADPGRETMENLHRMKQELILLRRAVWPLRDLINRLLRDETDLIKESTHVYLRDVYDHTVQVIDTIETFRDVVSGMLDIYLSSISNKMNEVMKILTIFAAIFIPLTFIAGIYGMNFNTQVSPFNMPELNWFFGYPFALVLMLVVGLGMAFFFKKKGWW